MEQLIKVGSYFIMWLLFLFLDIIWFELFVLFLVHLCIPGIKVCLDTWRISDMDLLSTAHIYNIIKKERRKGQNSVSMINNYTIQLCLSILAETDRYSCNWDCSEWLAISQSQTLRSFWRMCRFINGICSFRSDIIHSFFHFTVA